METYRGDISQMDCDLLLQTIDDIIQGVEEQAAYGNLSSDTTVIYMEQ